ncbi:MAG: membrane integrity-associated transporter subunit PqiC [Armatimonadetes bacterium]|nr:membrane integrity-associated transporter subunit PqiC [Armatimonadota bacterium]
MLNATWGILDGRGNTITPATRAHLRTPVAEDGGYRELVAAQGEAVAQLSRAIAAAAKGLKKPGAERILPAESQTASPALSSDRRCPSSGLPTRAARPLPSTDVLVSNEDSKHS